MAIFCWKNYGKSWKNDDHDYVFHDFILNDDVDHVKKLGNINNIIYNGNSWLLKSPSLALNLENKNSDRPSNFATSLKINESRNGNFFVAGFCWNYDT